MTKNKKTYFNLDNFVGFLLILVLMVALYAIINGGF